MDVPDKGSRTQSCSGGHAELLGRTCRAAEADEPLWRPLKGQPKEEEDPAITSSYSVNMMSVS